MLSRLTALLIALSALAPAASLALAAPVPPTLPGTPFCQRYACARVGTLPIRPSTLLDLYTLPGASLAELRVWRDGVGVPGAAYVLHTPVDVADSKLPVIAQFLSAAVGVPVSARDVRRAWTASPDELRRAAAASRPASVIHRMRGGVPYTLQVVQDITETNATPDWSVTVRLYRSQALPQLWSQRPDPWGQKPVLSRVAGQQLATFELNRWLDLSPAQQRSLDALVAEDAAFVQASAAVGQDAAHFNTQLARFLEQQDARLRALLGAQYPSFRAWVRTGWAALP